MRTALTVKQSELLEYIQAFSERKGHAPSYEQMRQAMVLASRSGIHRLILALEERGFIRRIPNRARAIEVVAPRARYSSAAEIHITAYCQRNRVDRESAVALAVESYFGGAA